MYTEEKKERYLLQMQSLFFNKGVNFALNTSFHILVWTQRQQLPA